MEIDRTTLADLEVFEAPDGTGGLFALIDRTATRLGRSALRRRIENPPSEIPAIRRTQAAVDFLRRHPGMVRLDEAFIDPVDQYLRSNIIPVASTSGLRERIEHVWMRVRYRDLLEEVGDGVAASSMR